jgi:CxxC-x17-CxxC domain-containing protein
MAKYKEEHDCVCSGCGKAFKLPFRPVEDMPYYGPTCTIKQCVQTETKYFKAFIVFLNDQLGLGKDQEISVKRKPEGNVYEVFLIEKGKDPDLLCTLTWKPKDPLRMHDKKFLLIERTLEKDEEPEDDFPYEAMQTPVPMAIVKIKAKNPIAEPIIEKFVKREGIEAKSSTSKRSRWA